MDLRVHAWIAVDLCHVLLARREGHAVVGEERDGQPVASGGIGVDRGGHGVDQPDDQLRHRIARRRFPTEDHRAWEEVDARVVSQPVVERDDVKQVQQLALVLVDALDLHVEQRIEVDPERRAAALVLTSDGVRQAELVLALRGPPRDAEAGVVRERGELAELRQIGDPPRADRVADEPG
jgi:hypothetical protein